LGGGGGGSAVRKIYCTMLLDSPPKPSYGPWKLMSKKLPMDLYDLYGPVCNAFEAAYVHKTTYEPLIDTAPYVMLLMDLPASKALRTGPYK
jgi:hypothetical protein